jgi:hypothetical protein
MAVQAQSHIHIDTDLEGAPEYSPTNKYTALSPEQRQHHAHTAYEYAVDATLMTHKVTESGDVKVSNSRAYKLKVTRAEYEALLADLGHTVYFIPNYHPDDGEDHTAYRSQVEFGPDMAMQERERDLSTLYVTIKIQES